MFQHFYNRPTPRFYRWSVVVLCTADGIWNAISNLNLLGLFSTERGKRDLENEMIDWNLRMKNDTPNAIGCNHLDSVIFAFMQMVKLARDFKPKPFLLERLQRVAVCDSNTT